MPTKNPRINVLLDGTSYQKIRFLAEKEGISISNKAGNLIKEALEIEEDLLLAQFAEDRENTLDTSSALSHEDVWS